MNEPFLDEVRQTCERIASPTRSALVMEGRFPLSSFKNVECSRSAIKGNKTCALGSTMHPGTHKLAEREMIQSFAAAQ